MSEILIAPVETANLSSLLMMKIGKMKVIWSSPRSFVPQKKLTSW